MAKRNKLRNNLGQRLIDGQPLVLEEGKISKFTLLLAAGEVKRIAFIVPATITESGEPAKAAFEIHNTSPVNLAHDLEISFDPNRKPEILIEQIVRQPTSRENGELHEASQRRGETFSMVRDLRDGNVNNA